MIRMKTLNFLNNLDSMNFVIVDVETTGGSPKAQKLLSWPCTSMTETK